MASFLERLLGRKEPTSADMARERLKLVLVTDRSNLPPDKLEQMQAEIIQVIKKYLQIDEIAVQIKLEQRERQSYLVADIPLARSQPQYANTPAPHEASRPSVPAADAEAEKPGSAADTESV